MKKVSVASTASKPAAKPAKPSVAAKAAASTGSKTVAQTISSKTAGAATPKSSKVAAKADAKTAAKSGSKADSKIATKGVAKSASRSTARSDARSTDRNIGGKTLAKRGAAEGRAGRAHERVAVRERRGRGGRGRHRDRVARADGDHDDDAADAHDVRAEVRDEARPSEHAEADEAKAHTDGDEEFDTPEPAAAVAAAAPTSGASVDQHVNLRQGDTLESVLTAHGVSAGEAQHWAEVAEGAYDLQRFYPHRGLTLRFDRDSRALERVLYEIDDKGKLVLDKTSEGIQASQQGLPYYIEVRGTASKISRTLRDDAARVGVPDRIVTTLAEVFGWEADAEAETPGGDEFRVLYENIWRAGYAYPETGKLLAAELVRNGQHSGVVYFEDHDGKGGYYRPTGEAMSRAFLRYPVEFTEITSGFGWRYHPILHVGRPHKGVDFAAPTGTDVHAASDGRVVKAGWSRGFGRCVKIEHLEGYVSTYGHLSGIVDGLSEGSIVERGQLIGYVGATGLATGPHLHYEVERWGEAIDPLEMTAMPEQPVQDGSRSAFEKTRIGTAKQMAILPVDESTRILAGTAVAAPSAAYEAE